MKKLGARKVWYNKIKIREGKLNKPERMIIMTKMEIEGMKNGCFNMAKDEGIRACREYRAYLENLGYTTWLEHFSGDLFSVKSSK